MGSVAHPSAGPFGMGPLGRVIEWLFDSQSGKGPLDQPGAGRLACRPGGASPQLLMCGPKKLYKCLQFGSVHSQLLPRMPSRRRVAGRLRIYGPGMPQTRSRTRVWVLRTRSAWRVPPARRARPRVPVPAALALPPVCARARFLCHGGPLSWSWRPAFLVTAARPQGPIRCEPEREGGGGGREMGGGKKGGREGGRERREREEDAEGERMGGREGGRRRGREM